MLKRWTGSVYSDVVDVKRWNGAAWQQCSFVKRWDGSTWITVWPAGGGGGGGGGGSGLSANANENATFYDSCIKGPTDPLTICPVFVNGVTNAVNILTSGGTGAGPTYAWTIVSGDTGIAISSTTASSVTFSASLTRNAIREALWKCTVTRGVESVEVFVNVTLQYEYILEGTEPV